MQPAGGAWASPTKVDADLTTKNATLDTTVLGDGAYDIRVVAIDNAGNGVASPAAQNVIVDNTAPTTSDDAPALAQSQAVTVALTASDSGSGVFATHYKVDGGATQDGSSVLIDAPSSHANDGEHTIVYWSVDAAGNVESTHTISVVIDTTPPSGPALDSSLVLRGTTTLTATSTDAAVASVAFAWSPSGAGTFTTIATDTTAPYSADWDTTTRPDGDYDIRVTVTDRANNSTSSATTKRIDNTAPTASVTAPTDGARRSGTFPLAGSASDAGSGLATIAIQIKKSGSADFETVGSATASP